MTPPQLVEKMKSKGINFDIISKQDAVLKLNKSTYYFKIGVYRYNFPKNSEGLYTDLDFAYLDDLATIDRKLRKTLLEMSLNLEHSLKTLILSNISKDHSENGYSIVTDFEFEKNFNITNCFKNHQKKNSYLYPINKKYSSTPSIWVLLELMSFGELSKFIEFYYGRTTTSKSLFKLPERLIKYAKNIRNATAHNNPLILNLKGVRISPDPKIMQYNAQIGLDPNFYRNPKINDIICLFFLHDLCCSKGVKNNVKFELLELKNRIKKNKYYYKNNKHLLSVYKNFSLLVDYYEKKW